MTFGGGCFFGHGVNVTGGAANLSMIDFSIRQFWIGRISAFQTPAQSAKVRLFNQLSGLKACVKISEEAKRACSKVQARNSFTPAA
jgi:hypothetical protein